MTNVDTWVTTTYMDKDFFQLEKKTLLPKIDDDHDEDLIVEISECHMHAMKGSDATIVLATSEI